MAKKNLTFTIEQRDTSQVVIDSLGYFCGIFDTVANAEIAIPKIKASINRGFIHSWLLKPRQQHNRKQSSQVSNKNLTPRRSNQTSPK